MYIYDIKIQILLQYIKTLHYWVKVECMRIHFSHFLRRIKMLKNIIDYLTQKSPWYCHLNSSLK